MFIWCIIFKTDNHFKKSSATAQGVSGFPDKDSYDHWNIVFLVSLLKLCQQLPITCGIQLSLNWQPFLNLYPRLQLSTLGKLGYDYLHKMLYHFHCTCVSAGSLFETYGSFRLSSGSTWLWSLFWPFVLKLLQVQKQRLSLVTEPASAKDWLCHHG